jgi:hypothetical protein
MDPIYSWDGKISLVIYNKLKLKKFFIGKRK